jgi:signal transduction histidine kinase
MYPKAYLKFSIEDSGIGIKEEDHHRLFKIFGKVSNSESINPHGIGLGLTICNKILGSLGSKLEFKSEFGKGTEFFFFIKLPKIKEDVPIESHNTSICNFESFTKSFDKKHT